VNNSRYVHDANIEIIITKTRKMVNKITNIKERVLQIAKSKNVSYEKFCEDIGMTYGSFKGVARDRPINSDALEIIIANNPDVDVRWLMTGEGEMYKNFGVATDIFPEETIKLKAQIELLKEQLLEERRKSDELLKKIGAIESKPSEARSGIYID